MTQFLAPTLPNLAADISPAVSISPGTFRNEEDEEEFLDLVRFIHKLVEAQWERMLLKGRIEPIVVGGFDIGSSHSSFRRLFQFSNLYRFLLGGQERQLH